MKVTPVWFPSVRFAEFKCPDDVTDKVMAPNRNVSYLFIAYIAWVKMLAINLLDPEFYI